MTDQPADSLEVKGGTVQIDKRRCDCNNISAASLRKQCKNRHTTAAPAPAVRVLVVPAVRGPQVHVAV